MNGTSNKIAKGDHELPPADSPSVRLAHPTREERLCQLNLNGVAWRGALALEAYLRREDYLSNQEATKDGGLTSWVLVNEHEDGSRQVLCGCETYRKRALVASHGRVKETVAHGVGSVFCPEDKRGRGYAGRMMEDLGEHLKTWQSDDICLFSILFSDIGKVQFVRPSASDAPAHPQ